ncbi:N-acetylmuramic acid 6-phosphate etherase [Escherichia sp. HC-TM1]
MVGIAASGRTPYVIAGLEYARQLGCRTVGISCNPGSAVSTTAEFAITPIVGAEVVTGSSRMKAGTAQKLVLNMLSTGLMIKSGKVFGNLMVDVVATNEKLHVRQVNIVKNATGCNAEQAEAALIACERNCKTAIVMMSSVTGDMVADPGETAYALTKAAIVGLTKSLAVEYAQSGIRVNAICPGYVRTPMAESIARQSNPEDPESVLTEMAKAIPMRRLADPLEVGELAAFLASDESSYLTGTQNVIDGGSTLPETVSVGI